MSHQNVLVKRFEASFLEDYQLEKFEKQGSDFHKGKMHVDFFSGTFYSLRKKYQKEYMLLTSDQADYLFESLFLMAIQVLLCILIWLYDTGEIQFQKEFSLNLCMFFTNLVMHFSCIATIRNGIDMCRHVVYHSHEFRNPKTAFMFGVCIVLTNWLCAFTNMA